MTNTVSTHKTAKEVAQLKNDWLLNTEKTINIEDTEGFEAYYDELKAWRENIAKLNVNEAELPQLEKQLTSLNNFINLKFHETLKLTDSLFVTKVVGGWVYTTSSGGISFVPSDDSQSKAFLSSYRESLIADIEKRQK